MSKYERKAQSQRKHNPSVSGAPKSAGPGPSSRPGWKGPGFVKKVSRPQPSPSPSASSDSATPLQPHLLPQELQQLILTVFQDTFPASKDFDALKPVLQEVKDALFQRDFKRAFGREDYLEAYAVRWSPSRALAYSNVLASICDAEGADLRCIKRLVGAEEDEEDGTARVVCFGGGAAEVMAFGALMRHLRPEIVGKPASLTSDASESIDKAVSGLSISDDMSKPLLSLHLIDMADWSVAVQKLTRGMTTLPELSKYASASAKASNAPFLQYGMIESTCTTTNVLDTDPSKLLSMKSLLGTEPTLITLLFTLNELYSASIPQTTAFLFNITLAAPTDSVLLVIDSPGSYSETVIGKAKDGEEEEKKRHPMHWLMDYALLSKFSDPRNEGTEQEPQKVVLWEKIMGEESRWFRLLEGLKYPVSLENMRFQVHLYKRL